MDKSPDAFRTISEVADFLETPAHVLRFWESRFPQIRPVKRAGGRRYYRPADVALLTGIKRLLHDEGMTIRGVQKILREQGVRHVAGLSGEAYVEDSDQDAEAALEQALALNFGERIEGQAIAPEQAATATVVALETALRRQDAHAEPEIAPVEPAFVPPIWPTAATLEPAAPGEDLQPDPEAPFIDVDDSYVAETVVFAARPSEVPRPVSLSARLRALPARALHSDPAAGILLHRMQDLLDRMRAEPDPAAHSR